MIEASWGNYYYYTASLNWAAEPDVTDDQNMLVSANKVPFNDFELS